MNGKQRTCLVVGQFQRVTRASRPCITRKMRRATTKLTHYYLSGNSLISMDFKLTHDRSAEVPHNGPKEPEQFLCTHYPRAQGEWDLSALNSRSSVIWNVQSEDDIPFPQPGAVAASGEVNNA